MGVPMAGPYVGSLPMIPSNPTPLYFVLMLALTFFMWSSTMNGMADADKSECVAPGIIRSSADMAKSVDATSASSRVRRPHAYRL